MGFEAPGPGSWFLDTTHFSGPVTRFVREVFAQPVANGFGDGTRPYGLLLDRIEWSFLGSWPYLRPRPVEALEAAGELTRSAWDRLLDSSSALQDRLATSAAVFERRRWRADLELWDEEVKPASIQGHEEIAGVELAQLGLHDLLRHVGRCRANLRRALYRHHRFNVAAVIAVGDFLVHSAEWTGRPVSELLGALRSATPVFLGGADIDEPGLEDVPGLARSMVAEARLGSARSRGARQADQAAASLRDSVPGSERPAFDGQLAEARATYRLRDERATFCDVWALGLARRSVLALGARLAEIGMVEQPSHLLEAGHEEMRSLAGGGDSPSAADLVARARERARAKISEVPPHLGPPPRAPVPAEWLPSGAGRTERAFRFYMAAMEEEAEEDGPGPVPSMDGGVRLRGVGASPGRYEGRACVVGGPGHLDRVLDGDVLVTASTSAAFNVVLPLLGAIVTDQGGLLSHAAIVAREFEIPAVVGTGDATRLIAGGAQVMVDGDAGEVWAPA